MAARVLSVNIVRELIPDVRGDLEKTAIDKRPVGGPVAVSAAGAAEVGLAGHEDKFPRQLSLGQQRRLSLARAFAARPDILLMDEPFASLDPDTAGRMTALTARLLDRSGAGLVLVTHDGSEAARLGAAPLRLAGNPAVLAADPAVQG